MLKNKIAKLALAISVVNVLIFLLSFALPVLFVFFFLAVGLEFIAGLFMLIDKDSRERGLAFLLASGICLLIGYSVCSTMTFNMH